MTVKIERGKSIFELNPGLGQLFPKLTEDEMEYVVYVADAQSILRMKPEPERRKIALKLVAGYMEKGKITPAGKMAMDKKNRKIEEGVRTFHSEINNNKQGKIMNTLETLNKYYDDQLKFMAEDAGDFDEKIKKQAANAKIIKDETIKETYKQIKFFEEELSHEFVIPESIVEDITDAPVEVPRNTADWIDVDLL
jgi:hypothetical protein